MNKRVGLSLFSFVTILLFAISAVSISCSKKNKSETGGSVEVKFVNSQLAISQLELADRILEREFSIAPIYNVSMMGTPCNGTCPCNTQTNMCIEDPNNQDTPIGTSKASELESLSYRLGYVSLLNSVTTNGSGWSNPTGNWDILNDSESTPLSSPDAAYGDSKFINILDKAALGRLTNKVVYTDKNVGTYNFAMMNWSQAIRFKSTVTLSDGTKLYSKKPVSYEPPDSSSTGGGSTRYTSIGNNLTTGPAEEAVVWSDSGGTYFKLQKPFEITQADIDSKTSFKIAFAFDSDGIVRGLKQNGKDGGTLVDATGGFKMQTPYLSIAPVVARESETIMRETYLLRHSETGRSFDVRLSLYYIKEDADKGIRAVNTSVLYTETIKGASQGNRALENIFSIATNPDSTISLRDSLGQDVFSNFKRLAKVGDTGTLSGFCRVQAACGAGTSMPYVLVSLGEIEGSLTAIAVTPTPTPTASQTP